MSKEKTVRERALEFAKKNVPKPQRRGMGIANEENISTNNERARMNEEAAYNQRMEQQYQ